MAKIKKQSFLNKEYVRFGRAAAKMNLTVGKYILPKNALKDSKTFLKQTTKEGTYKQR